MSTSTNTPLTFLILSLKVNIYSLALNNAALMIELLKEVFDMLESISSVFDPKKITVEREKLEAQRLGYDCNEFKWFGASIPDNLNARCLMCEYCFNLGRELLFKKPTFAMPEVCPECRRKSLKVSDGRFWKAYFEYRLWEFDLFLDQYKESYALHSNGREKIMLVDSEALKRILVLRTKNPDQAMGAIKYMDALAARNPDIRTLQNRVLQDEEGIWIDACSPMGEAIFVGKDGWKIVDHPGTRFRQFDHQKPLLVQPGTKEDFMEYIGLMNLSSETDRILFMGYAPTLFMPGIEHPILMCIGPQGAAKTTMSKMTRMICDPSEVPALTLPKDAEKLPLIFYSHYCPIFDNISYIEQPQSDMLCSGVTGGGITARKLYTNKDMMTLSFQLPIILNGLTVPSASNDLIDRALIIRLDRVDDGLRVEKSIVEAKRDALLPRVRGYLLTTLSDALYSDNPKPKKIHRLADFCRLADACLVEMGYPSGRFTDEYLRFSDEASIDAIRSDPLADALLDLLDSRGGWNGSATELKKVLETEFGGNPRSDSWPEDSTRVSDAIFGRLKPGLIKMGWFVERKKSGSKRTIIIHNNTTIKDSS